MKDQLMHCYIFVPHFGRAAGLFENRERRFSLECQKGVAVGREGFKMSLKRVTQYLNVP